MAQFASSRWPLCFAWTVDLFLLMAVFGVQVVVGDNAMAGGPALTEQQFVADFMDAIAFAAPGTAMCAAILVLVSLLLAWLILGQLRRRHFLIYAIAGASVAMLLLGLQDGSIHWISGLVGGIALLAAAWVTHPRA